MLSEEGGSSQLVRILDGGTASELVRMGFPEIDGDPLYSSRLLATDPSAVKEVHKKFLKAGADVLVTNTYQASIDGFTKHLQMTKEEALGLMKHATQLCREACEENTDKAERKVVVAGGLGPYGAVLNDGSEYTGNYIEKISIQELIDWHRPKLAALLETRVDMIAIETLPAQKEAEAAALLLQEFPACQAWISFSCKDGNHTVHGEPFVQAVQSVVNCDQVTAVGVNCTAPRYIASLLKSIEPLNIQKPIIVKPNSGEMWEAQKGWHGKEMCQNLSVYVPEWLSLGVQWIGGCCRVYPEDISQLKKAVGNHYKSVLAC